MTSKCPSIKPMPTTGKPDRLERDAHAPPAENMKAGVTTSGDMCINPGRKSDGK